MAGSAWIPVWVAFAVFAHAFAALVLARSALRRQALAGFKLLTKLFQRLCGRSGAWLQAHMQAAIDAMGAGTVIASNPVLRTNRAGTRQEGKEPGSYHQSANAGPTCLPSETKADHVDTLAAAQLRHHQPQVALLAWQGVGCSYPGPGGRPKTVLQDCMGIVCAGQLTGLLGPSGSGKSTLLEILAGRKSLGNLSGRIAVAKQRPRLHAGYGEYDAHMHSPAGCIEADGGNVPCQHHVAVNFKAVAIDTTEAKGLQDVRISTAEGKHGRDLGHDHTEAQSGCPLSTSEDKSEGTAGNHTSCSENSQQKAQASSDSKQAGSQSQQQAGPTHVGGSCELVDTSLLAWRDVKQHALAIKQLGAFVPQDSAFPPSLTAEEVMQVHASLLGLHTTRGLCGGAAAAAQQLAVERTLQDVGLANQARTLVGGPLPGGLLLRGLSGGERKRLAVACGLLGTPLLLLLDEPTTGLDATTAAALMSRLSHLCHRQRISVLCSLHQPRAAIWSMLDVVVVLSGGFTIYSGCSHGLVPWLTQELEYGYMPALHGSPPDWVLDLVNINFAKPKKFFSNTMYEKEDLAAAAAAFSADWADKHADLDKPASVVPCIAAAAEQQLLEGVQDERLHAGASWLQQVRVLAWREAALVVRNPADMAGRALVFCWAGLVTGAVFYATALDVQGMGLRAVLLYAECAVLFLLPFVYMSLYTADRRIFVAELTARLYPPSAYYMAKALLLVVFSSVNSCIFSAVAYGMSGLVPEAGPLLAHMLVAMLAYLTAQQVLYCAAIVSPNQDVAFMMGILWTAVNILLANYPMRLVEYTMTWVRPLRYISAMYYAFSGLLTIEFRRAPAFSCAGGLGESMVAELPDYLPTLGVLRYPAIQRLLREPGADCQLSPQGMLDFFNLSWPWWSYMLLLAAYLLVLHAASLAALVLVSRKERR